MNFLKVALTRSKLAACVTGGTFQSIPTLLLGDRGRVAQKLGSLTSHLSRRENKVLKKKTTQITGQMTRPSQKMRASASVAAVWPGDTWPRKGSLLSKPVDTWTPWAFPGSASSRASRGPREMLSWEQVVGQEVASVLAPLDSAHHGPHLSGFKNPVALPIFINLVPPAEAHQESSSNVLRNTDKKSQRRA